MPELRDEERKVLLSFASRVERSDPGALNNLGVLYFRKGMYEEAMEQFKEALKVDPKFDLARENLQYLFAETGLEDADVRRWRDEVKRDPENFEAMLRLGVSYQNMGRFREAAEMLGAVVEKNPDHTMARFHLAITLKAQGLYQQALEHYLYIGGAFREIGRVPYGSRRGLLQPRPHRRGDRRAQRGDQARRRLLEIAFPPFVRVRRQRPAPGGARGEPRGVPPESVVSEHGGEPRPFGLRRGRRGGGVAEPRGQGGREPRKHVLHPRHGVPGARIHRRKR